MVEVEVTNNVYLYHIKNITTGHYECEVVNQEKGTYFAKLYIQNLGKTLLCDFFVVICDVVYYSSQWY